jgi:hypothetical protein
MFIWTIETHRNRIFSTVLSNINLLRKESPFSFKRNWRVGQIAKNFLHSWYYNVHFCVYKTPPPMSRLSLLNRVHTLTAYLPKIHLNIIHPYTPKPLKLLLPFRFSNKRLMHFSSFRACNNWLASHLPLFNRRNNVRFRAQIVKPLVKEFSPASHCSFTMNLIHASEITLVLPQIPNVQKTRLYYILLWSLNLFLSACDREAYENTWYLPLFVKSWNC